MANSLSTPTQNVSKRVTSHDVEVWDRLIDCTCCNFIVPACPCQDFGDRGCLKQMVLLGFEIAWQHVDSSQRFARPGFLWPEKPLRSLQLSTLHLPAQPIILEQKSLVALRKVHTLAGVSYRDLVAFVEVALVKARVGYLYCLDLVPLCCMLNS